MQKSSRKMRRRLSPPHPFCLSKNKIPPPRGPPPWGGPLGGPGAPKIEKIRKLKKLKKFEKIEKTGNLKRKECHVNQDFPFQDDIASKSVMMSRLIS